MSLFVLVGLLAALLALGFVLYPILRPTPPVRGESGSADLAERRRDIYQQILDLEFEQRLGKIDEADARDLTGDLLRQAAALIAQESSANRDVHDQIEQEIQALRRALFRPNDPEPGVPSPAVSQH